MQAFVSSASVHSTGVADAGGVAGGVAGCVADGVGAAEGVAVALFPVGVGGGVLSAAVALHPVTATTTAGTTPKPVAVHPRFWTRVCMAAWLPGAAGADDEARRADPGVRTCRVAAIDEQADARQVGSGQRLVLGV